MIYKIFGYNIKISFENDNIKEILKQELSLYSISKNSNIDVEITFVDKIKMDMPFSHTPSIHKTYQNAFMAQYGSNKILYKKIEEKIEVQIEINTNTNFLKKFISIGYRNNIENVGQILHELVLVPINFFYNDRALVHASSMKSNLNKKTIMIGGTGGVGKTSLELLLCRELDYSFISDDIAVISSDAKIFPNLSYPKIYAYNVSKNEKMKKLLFNNRTLIDKFQWNFINYFRGENKVRRAIAPDKIYKSFEQNSNFIDDYYILFKTDEVNSIQFEEISSKKASKLTLAIIKNEYQSVLQHIIWHEYNADLMNSNPIIKVENIFSTWSNVYNKNFQNIKCYIVKIPINISHNDFLQQMKLKFEK